MSTFVEGDEIGNYILEICFPRGQGGEAWLVTAKNRNVKRVLKLPNFDADSATREIQRKGIEMEFTMLSLMKSEFSPPVVGLFEKGSHKHPFGQSYPYIVMELIPDNFKNLEDHLNNAQEQGVLPSLEMLEMFDILLEVLEKTHNLGYVYNDVDIKHVFWDNTDLTIGNDQIRRRMRIIDWANAYRLDDPNKPLEVSIASDINQAGNFLYTIVIYVFPPNERSFGVPHNHPDADIALLAEEARNRQIPSVATFRSRIHDLIAIRTRQLKAQIETIYSSNFKKALQTYHATVSDETLMDFLRRVDSILNTLHILRESYHHFFEPSFIAEDNIRKETLYEILDFLDRSTKKWELIAALKKYSIDLTDLNAEKNRLETLVEYIERTHEVAFDYSHHLVSQRLIQTWNSLWQKTDNPKILITEMLQLSEQEEEIISSEEWYLLSQQAAILEEITFNTRPTTLDTEVVSLPNEQLNDFHNAFVDHNYPISKAYFALASYLAISDSIAYRIGQSLQKYETLSEQPRTPFEDYRHRHALEAYCANLAQLYNEQHDIQQFEIFDEMHFREWMQRILKFVEDWSTYAPDQVEAIKDSNAQLFNGFRRLEEAVDNLDLRRVIDEMVELIKQTKDRSTSLQGYLQRWQLELKTTQTNTDPRTLWQIYTLDIGTRARWANYIRIYNDLLNSDIGNSFNRENIKQLNSINPESMSLEDWPIVLRPIFSAVFVKELVGGSGDIESISDVISTLPQSELLSSASDRINKYKWKQSAYMIDSFDRLIDVFKDASTTTSLRTLLQSLLRAKSEIEGDAGEILRSTYGKIETEINKIPENQPFYIFASKVLDSHKTIYKQINILHELNDNTIQRGRAEIDAILDVIMESCNNIGVSSRRYLDWSKQAAQYLDQQGELRQQADGLRELVKQAEMNNDPLLRFYRVEAAKLERQAQEKDRQTKTLRIRIIGGVLILTVILVGIASTYAIITNNNNNATSTSEAILVAQQTFDQQTAIVVATQNVTETQVAGTATQYLLETQMAGTIAQHTIETQSVQTATHSAAETQIAGTATMAQLDLEATQTSAALSVTSTFEALPTPTQTIAPNTARRRVTNAQGFALYYDPYLHLLAPPPPDDITLFTLISYIASPIPIIAVEYNGITYWVEARLLEYNENNLASLPIYSEENTQSTNILRETTYLLQDPSNAGIYSIDAFNAVDNSACVRSDLTSPYFNIAGRWELGGGWVTNQSNRLFDDESQYPATTEEAEQQSSTTLEVSPQSSEVISLSCDAEDKSDVMYVPLNLSIMDNSVLFPNLDPPVVNFRVSGGFQVLDRPQQFGVNLLVNLPSTGKKALLWVLFEYTPDTDTSGVVEVRAYLDEVLEENVAVTLNNLPSSDGIYLYSIPISSTGTNNRFNIGINFAYEQVSTNNPILIFLEGEAFALDQTFWENAAIPVTDFISENIEQINLVASKDADIYFDTIEITDR